jgi:hypothetical protein
VTIYTPGRERIRDFIAGVEQKCIGSRSQGLIVCMTWLRDLARESPAPPPTKRTEITAATPYDEQRWCYCGSTLMGTWFSSSVAVSSY